MNVRYQIISAEILDDIFLQSFLQEYWQYMY